MDTVVDIAVGLIALGALVVAILANRNASRSAGASEDSARQAKRSADAAERQARAAEASIPTPPPAVAWVAEARGKETYVLRNVGTDTATGVKLRLPADRKAPVHVELGDGTVPTGHSFQVVVSRVAEERELLELAVIWDGQEVPVAVPLPPQSPTGWRR